MGATPGLYLDQALSNVSQQFRNTSYAATMIFPRVPVPQISGRIWRAGFERFHRYNTARAPGGEAREMVRSDFVNDVFRCDRHDLKKLVSDDERRTQAPGFEIDITTTEELSDAILLDIELQGYNLVVAGTIPNVTLSGVNQWSDFVNSDPIAAVHAQKSAILKGATRRPNLFAVGYDVHLVLQQHPKIIDRFKYTQVGILQAEHLKAAFDVDKYVILEALYDTAAMGAAPSLDYVWSKLALLAWVPDEPAIRTPSLGYSFWFHDEVTAGGPAIYRYRWEIRAGDFIEARSYRDIRLLWPNAGYLWKSAVA